MMCNCSNVKLCPLDRITVYAVPSDFTDSSIVHTSETDRVPEGYHLVCHLPSALTEKGFGCKMETKKDMYDCISGNAATKVCPYGTAAAHVPKVNYERRFYEFSCVQHPPCPRGKVLYYDTITGKYFCLTSDEQCTTLG